VKELLNDRTTPLTDHCSKDLPVFVDVHEHLSAVREDAILRACGRQVTLPLARLKQCSQTIEATDQQVLLVLELRAKRRRPDVRAIDDVVPSENRVVLEGIAVAAGRG
jgi:hypothetical protein